MKVNMMLRYTVDYSIRIAYKDKPISKKYKYIMVSVNITSIAITINGRRMNRNRRSKFNRDAI